VTDVNFTIARSISGSVTIRYRWDTNWVAWAVEYFDEGKSITIVYFSHNYWEGSMSELPNDAYARSSDPETSHDAAKKACTARFSLAVMNILNSHENATQQEVVFWTGLPNESITPRFAPLVRDGFIRVVRDAEGRIVKRSNPRVPKGRKGQVYEVVK
jgi:hypothetical protein